MKTGQNIPFKFLVADDSEFARKSLIMALSRIGGNLAGEAFSGQDAVQKYRCLKPDIVFMDITMPGMEGIDALERILQDDSSAKVVIVSSLSHREIVKNALKKGAKHYITKPIQIAPLADIIQFVLSR
ncbi:MAG TPA: response regulator [Nitrospirota bacterium]|nr:response regulator [Nitrospirota bacterium]